jgi:hypothetical protein
VVTLARQRDGLVAVLRHAAQEESGLRCALTQVPIAEGTSDVCPAAPRVIEAWRHLARGRLDDAPGIASALVVLLETVPLAEGTATRVPLPTRPAGVRRTAAHPWGVPRPRRRRPRVADLRRIVAFAGAWPGVRQALRGHPGPVLGRLEDLGYDGAALAQLVDARDPYVAYHHHAPLEAGLQALPAAFRASILPLLRSRPWSDVTRALSLFRALDLEREEALLALVVHLLALAPVHGVGWLAHLATQPPELRGAFLRMLLETGAHETDPAGVSRAHLDRLAGLDSRRYGDRLAYLCARLRAGVSAGRIFEAFRIADVFAPDHQFGREWRRADELLAPDPEVPPGLEAALAAVLVHTAAAVDDGWSGLPVALWKRSAEVPALARLLALRDLLEWPGTTTYRLLYSLVDADARTLDEHIRTLVGLLRRVPPAYHGKAIEAVETFFSRWRHAEVRRVRLPPSLALLARLARAPFKTDVDCGLAIAQLVDAAPPRSMLQLLNAPEASLRRLEAAVDAANGEYGLRRGLGALARRVGGLVVDAFGAHPEALLSTARTLGCMSFARSLAVLERFRGHPVMRRTLPARPVEEMCGTIVAAGTGLPSPIPRKLRDHLSGTAVLPPARLERHRQAVLRKLVPFKLALLRRMVLEDLALGLDGVDPEAVSERHALQMLGSVDCNRRLLRRVLRVPAAGRRAYLLAHPLSRTWLRKHPRVDVGLWTGGLVREADIPRHGPVRLAIETDPLEVLRMGTAVGSCLSVGGAHDCSAVAVMADVNKQVVFARRSDGSFVARQLLAISDDDRLVCFPVYPRTAPRAIQDAFQEYDASLASALGLPIWRREPDGCNDYEIADVLATDFYDDGAWER